MVALQNSAIERPEAIFAVELVVFGSISSSAVRRTVTVLAQTCRGARRICQSRYHRVEIKSARKTGPADAGVTADLFPRAPENMSGYAIP